MTNQERMAAIELLKNDLNKKAGDRYITTLVDQATIGLDVISTGILGLDIAIGVGGVPKGRLTEIYGPEQAGKTTVALQIAANAQRAGDVILYVDAEHSLDPEYCAKLGLDPERPDFLLCQPDFGEQALDTTLMFMRHGLVDVVIIDSIASLVPLSKMQALSNDEKDGSFEDFQKFVGLHARMMSAYCAVAPSIVRKNNVGLIGLNQIRKEITQMGAREGITGGNAWKHAASVRIDVRRIGTDMGGNKTDDTQYGISGETKAHIKKNKVAPPHRQAIFDIVFGVGADYTTNLIDLCVKEKIGVTKAGSWMKTVDEHGSVIASYRAKDLVQWFKTEDGIKHQQFMVDALSDRCGIVLYDPTRPDRHIGPVEGHHMEEPEAAEQVVAAAEEIVDQAEQAGDSAYLVM